MRIGLFAYNFPHKKSQDFLLRLYLEGFKVECVIACDPVELHLPKSILRVKPRHIDLMQPKRICERFGIPYRVTDHNSQEVLGLVSIYRLDIGVIAGARILKSPTIRVFEKGIINFHPGWIPDVRGIDALKWAVYKNQTIGVTAHFIDERTDAGRVILREETPLYVDDTLIDVSLRQHEMQVNMLPQALRLIENTQLEGFPLVANPSKPNRPMPNELEKDIPRLFAERLNQCNL